MFKTLDPPALGILGQQSEVIELALTFGFQAVDLDMAEYAARVERFGEAHARRLLDSAKLSVSTFGLPINWEVDDDAFRQELERFLPLAQLAKNLGARFCTAWVRPVSETRRYDENFDFHQRRFSDLAGVLEPYGLTLALGHRASAEHRQDATYEFIRDMKAVATLVQMVNKPSIKLLVDVWDLVVGGGSIEDIASLPVGSVAAVRVSDLPEDAESDPTQWTEEQRLVPGATGKIDLNEVFKSLQALEFDGPITPCSGQSMAAGSRRDKIVGQAAEAIDSALGAIAST